MTTKGLKRIEGMNNLTAALTAAIKAAHEAGIDAEDIKAEFEKFVTLLEEE